MPSTFLCLSSLDTFLQDDAPICYTSGSALCPSYGSFPNMGTPILTPKHYNPYYRDPNKAPPILGNSHISALHRFAAAHVHELSKPGDVKVVEAHGFRVWGRGVVRLCFGYGARCMRHVTHNAFCLGPLQGIHYIVGIC